MEDALTDQEFALFQRLIHDLAGISLSAGKKLLLVGRLSARVEHHGCRSFGEYYQLLASGRHPDEVQRVVDLLTTHETYFFREARHFDFLRDTILPARRATPQFRIWSAACSSGEEAYSMAMVLAEHRPHAAWEVFASDISRSVLAQAQEACYALDRTRAIPPALLRRYCLKGVRSQTGKILVGPELRERVTFARLNLTTAIGGVGTFDVTFLRNVMIYFDAETRRKVIDNMLPCLKPDGFFIVGHSESLTGITDRLRSARPTIYRLAGEDR